MKSSLDWARLRRSTDRMNGQKPLDLSPDLQYHPEENRSLRSTCRPRPCTYLYRQSLKSMHYKAFAPSISLRSSSHTTHLSTASSYLIRMRNSPPTLRLKGPNQLMRELSTNTPPASSGLLLTLSFSNHGGVV